MSRRKLCRLTPAQLRLLLGEINEQTEGGEMRGLQATPAKSCFSQNPRRARSAG